MQKKKALSSKLSHQLLSPWASFSFNLSLTHSLSFSLSVYLSASLPLFSLLSASALSLSSFFCRDTHSLNHSLYPPPPPLSLSLLHILYCVFCNFRLQVIIDSSLTQLQTILRRPYLSLHDNIAAGKQFETKDTFDGMQFTLLGNNGSAPSFKGATSFFGEVQSSTKTTAALLGSIEIPGNVSDVLKQSSDLFEVQFTGYPDARAFAFEQNTSTQINSMVIGAGIIGEHIAGLEVPVTIKLKLTKVRSVCTFGNKWAVSRGKEH